MKRPTVNTRYGQITGIFKRLTLWPYPDTFYVVLKPPLPSYTTVIAETAT
jgi:hypothetical protein